MNKKRIYDLANAYLLSSAIHAAAELGIADLLSEKENQSAEEISSKLNVDSRSLFRLLRFLVSHGIFSQNNEGNFSLNPESAYLAEGHPESIRHALLVNEGSRWNAMGALRKAVESGKPAFEALYDTTYYKYLAEHPEAFKKFHAHMTSYTQEEDRQIAPRMPLQKTKTLVDVGGGEGQFLSEILLHFSNINAILFDWKSNPSTDRWQSQQGDFFESVPFGGDAYILKRVLHNWSDEDCIRILKNIRRAMKKDSKVFIIEGIVPEDTAQHPSKDTDLFLMTLFPGCERTKNEFLEISRKAELQIERVLPTDTSLSIIELQQNLTLEDTDSSS